MDINENIDKFRKIDNKISILKSYYKWDVIKCSSLNNMYSIDDNSIKVLDIVLELLEVE